MLVVEFGSPVVKNNYKICFDDYTNMDSIIKRLSCDDVKNEHTVFTGKGYHGFVALVFGLLCNANVIVALDAPTFVDQENRDMYDDRRRFQCTFPDKYQDILKLTDTHAKIILNPATSRIQNIHTERLYIMFSNVVITDDIYSELDKKIDSKLELKQQKTDIVSCKVFRAGNYNKYFHFITDMVFPIIHHCQENSIKTVHVQHNEPLVIKHLKDILEFFSINVFFSHDAPNITLKGMNTNFNKPIDTIIESFSNVLHPNNRKYVILIRRPTSNKRYIVNHNELLTALKYKYGIVLDVDPLTMNMREHIELFSNASLVISQYGGALTNMVFMHKDSNIVEIDKTATRKRFEILSSYLGIKHHKYVYTNNSENKMDAEKCTIDVSDFMGFINNLKG